MAWDILVRTFYSDSGLAVGLARGNDQLRNLARSGPNAGAGLRAVEQGIRTLAFSATGLPGPLGRIAGGLLQLGGGNALMLGALAGLAAAGAAIRALTKDARDNAEAQEAMLDKLGKIGPHGEITEARARLADLQQQLADPSFIQRVGRVGKAFLGPLLGGASLEEQKERLKRAIREQEDIIAAAQKRLAEQTGGDLLRSAQAGLDAAQLRLRQAGLGTDPQVGLSRFQREEELRRLQLIREGRPEDVATEVARRERLTAEINARREATERLNDTQLEAQIRNQNLTASEEAVTEAIVAQRLVIEQGLEPALARVIAHEQRLATDTIKVAQIFRQQIPAAFAAMGAAAAQSMAAVVQSAISSVAQIAQSLPGISPVAGGVIGFAAGLLGGLFGHRSRPLPVEVTNAEELRPEGPDRFTLQLISATTGDIIEETIYELGRRTRLDRVVRIPRGVILRR